ncbi:YdgA family protein [Aliiglaciecola litoralis]|uniref:DUF945 domain-containing protein n=1 Tax=Aliiglaciecola litoralis TaxID=582857 RepID=A0ABP3WU09_9ALTE
MKKRYLLLTLLVAAILLVPKLVSTKVTDAVNNVTSELSAIDGYNVEVVEFNEGWFNSDGVIKVTLDLAKLAPDNDFDADKQMPQILLKLTSTHGPVFFGPAAGIGMANWRLVYDGSNLRDVLSFDKNQPFYEFSSTYGFFGGGTLEDKIPAFTATSPESDGVLNFAGFSGEGSYSNDNFNYQGMLESLNASGESGELNVENMSLAVQSDSNFMQALEGTLKDSEVEFRIASTQFIETDNTTPAFMLQDLALIISSDVNDEETLLDMTQRFSVAKLKAQDYVISDFSFNYEFNHLSVPFFQAYQELAKTMQFASEDEVQMQTMMFFQENAVTLLKAGPQLKITDFSGTLPQGQISITSDLQLVGIEALPAELTDPQFWVAHIAAQLDLNADKDVATLIANGYMKNQLANNPQTAGMSPEELEQIAVQQSPMIVDSLMQQGLLIEKEGKLSLSFSLKDSQATLNGNPMPLPF